MGHAVDLDELRKRITDIEKGSGPARVDSPSDEDPARIPRSDVDRSAAACSDGVRDEDAAFSFIVRKISHRDRSSRELMRMLVRDGYDDEVARCAVSRARSCRIIDDLRFADAFVRSKVAQGRGRRGIEEQLSQHGVAASELPDWPDGYFEAGDESELDRAIALLEAKPPRSKNPRESAYRKLVSRGFSSSVAGDAARIWAERSAASMCDLNA